MNVVHRCSSQGWHVSAAKRRVCRTDTQQSWQHLCSKTGLPVRGVIEDPGWRVDSSSVLRKSPCPKAHFPHSRAYTFNPTESMQFSFNPAIISDSAFPIPLSSYTLLSQWCLLSLFHRLLLVSLHMRSTSLLLLTEFRNHSDRLHLSKLLWGILVQRKRI